MGTRQEAEFYVNSGDTESLWEGERYYVIRNGEMRIHMGDEIIRYTDQLIAAGIGSDKVLSALNIASGLAETHDLFRVVDSPWFEVVDSEDPTDQGEVFHALDEAVERAQVLEARHAGTLSI
jgi:hypothetical protein